MIVFYCFLTAFVVGLVAYLYLLWRGDETSEIREERIRQEVDRVLNPPGVKPYPKSKE